MQRYWAQLITYSPRCAGTNNHPRPLHLLPATAWPLARKRPPLKIEFCLQHHLVLHYGSCLRWVAS